MKCLFGGLDVIQLSHCFKMPNNMKIENLDSLEFVLGFLTSEIIIIDRRRGIQMKCDGIR